MHALLHSRAPTLQQVTSTHGSALDSWTLLGKSGSVSCGVTAPFSWVLVHARYCVCPPRVNFPGLCKFCQLCGEVNGDLSKRANAIPMFPAPRAPVPVAVHCWHIPPQEMLTVLSQSLCGPWVLVCTMFVWAVWASLAGMGFDSKRKFSPPTILLVLLLCPWA